MRPEFKRVLSALDDLRQGKMVILTDPLNRENEGDLVAPAEIVTTDIMNFMIRQGTGIVCLTLTPLHLKKLNIPLMVSSDENSSLRGTPFTISVDAKDGITTGVSAPDRVQTIKAMMNEHAHPDHLVKPGHIFPLQAKLGGVLERQGHTEGAIDLVKLAGFKPAAVICEIMNLNGTMAKGQQLKQFAKLHQLKMVSIEDLITYRLTHENIIEEEVSTLLPLEHYGTFKLISVKEKFSLDEHLVLMKETPAKHSLPLVRIHSSCATGDLFSSKRCDCNKELHYALERISKEGGWLIYLNQEGRNIGLFNKIKAYALQDKGLDTVEANIKLNLPIDARKYYVAATILRNYNIQGVRLLTHNPDKIKDLKKFGITQVKKESMPIFHNEYNHHYLITKKNKLKHSINISEVGV